MFQCILVPLDGSPRAEEALPMASHLARATGASMILLRVMLPEQMHAHLRAQVSDERMEQLHETYFEEAQSYLKQTIDTARLQDIAVTTSVNIGNPDEVIVQVAQERTAQLIVMRSHGQTGRMRWLLGSVAQKVVRNSPIPVLVMRNVRSPIMLRPESLLHTPRILVALDGSLLSETALVPAAQLAHALAQPERGHIHLTCAVHAMTPNTRVTKEGADRHNKEARAEAMAYLQGIEARFRSGDLADFSLAVSSSVVTYHAREEIWKKILEECECIGDVVGYGGCDVIALATQGKTGLQRLREGSVTEDVLNAATYPLLIVRSQPVASEQVTHGAGAKRRHV